MLSDQNIALDYWFSITVPNLVQKCWLTPKLWPTNEIQNGGLNLWIPVAIFDIGYSWLSTVDLNHHTKFGANISIGGWLTVIFQNSRWRPSAILDFRKTWVLTNGWPWASDFSSRYQIWCKNVDRRPTYGPKSKSKMAAVHHLGIVVCSCKTTHEASMVVRISVSNFMSIRWTVLEIWGFGFLQIWLEMPIHAPKISGLGG